MERRCFALRQNYYDAECRAALFQEIRAARIH